MQMKRPAAFQLLLQANLLTGTSAIENLQKPLTWDQEANVSPREEFPCSGRRVAVIGAGTAGAVAAYHVHEHSRLQKEQPCIHVLEASDRIGGRVKTVDILVPGEQRNHEATVFKVDTGSRWISEDDWCLLEAAEHAGLRHSLGHERDYFIRRTGIWDGENRLEASTDVCMPEPPSNNFCGFGCLLHGLRESPIEFKRLWVSNIQMIRAIFKWNASDNYEAKSFFTVASAGLRRWKDFGRGPPFDSIAREIERCGLDKVWLDASATAFENQNLTSDFVRSVIQPCSRAFFAQNVEDLRGLHSVVAAGWRHGSYFLRGGTSRLLERLFRISGARISTHSIVTSIQSGTNRRYQLSISDDQYGDNYHLEFDEVILATPFGVKDSFVGAHTTVFESRSRLAPHYFSRDQNLTWIPERTFTTVLDPSKDPVILSIREETSCTIPPEWDCSDFECDTCEEEYVYTILSRQPISDDEIGKMLSLDADERKQDIEDYGVRWIYREEWPSAFHRYSRGAPVPDGIELAPGLLALGGGSEVVDTMEMSCRMGRNAARILDAERQTAVFAGMDVQAQVGSGKTRIEVEVKGNK